MEPPSSPLDDPNLTSGEFPSTPIIANLFEARVIVFNSIHGSLLYGFGRFFGSPVGMRKPKTHLFTRPLSLSLFEAVYLFKHQIINIQSSDGTTWSPDTFFEYACKKYPHFEEKYPIYEDLREKKYIPRPGQKFGADFIVYKQGPGLDHSSFCIQVLSTHTRFSSIDVMRSARLATSVKKRYILANPITKSYFSFKWFKP